MDSVHTDITDRRKLFANTMQLVRGGGSHGPSGKHHAGLDMVWGVACLVLMVVAKATVGVWDAVLASAPTSALGLAWRLLARHSKEPARLPSVAMEWLCFNVTALRPAAPLSLSSR